MEVYARNLPDHAEGAWKLSCSAEPAGEPINNVYDLEAALRGEPIRNFDWLHFLVGNTRALRTRNPARLSKR